MTEEEACAITPEGWVLNGRVVGREGRWQNHGPWWDKTGNNSIYVYGPNKFRDEFTVFIDEDGLPEEALRTKNAEEAFAIANILTGTYP